MLVPILYKRECFFCWQYSEKLFKAPSNSNLGRSHSSAEWDIAKEDWQKAEEITFLFPSTVPLAKPLTIFMTLRIPNQLTSVSHSALGVSF